MKYLATVDPMTGSLKQLHFRMDKIPSKLREWTAYARKFVKTLHVKLPLAKLSLQNSQAWFKEFSFVQYFPHEEMTDTVSELSKAQA